MPKFSAPAPSDSPDEGGVLDLSEEFSGALDTEAAAFVAPAPRRTSRSTKNVASGNAASSKNSSKKQRSSASGPVASGTAREKAPREDTRREAEPELDVFPAGAWRKSRRAAPGEPSLEARGGERVYRVNPTRSSRTAFNESGAKGASSQSGPRHKTRRSPSILVFEIAGILLLALGAVLLFNALLPHAEGVLPRIGVGALRFLFGLGAVVFPGLMCALGLLLIVRRHRANLKAFFWGCAVGFPVLLTAVHLQVPPGQEFLPVSLLWNGPGDAAVASALSASSPENFSHGGLLGASFAWGLRKMLGETGAIIALVSLAVVALLVLTNLSLADTVERAGRGVGRGAKRAGSKTRRVWRRGVEMAYHAPTDTQPERADPFARQLEERRHERPAERFQERSAPLPAPRPASFHVPPELRPSVRLVPRPANRPHVSPQAQDMPFGHVEGGEFAPLAFVTENRRVERRPSPFFPAEDFLSGAARPVEPALSAPIPPAVTPPAPATGPEAHEQSAPVPEPEAAKPVEKTPNKDKDKELRAVGSETEAPRIEIVDAPPPPSVVDTATETKSVESVPVNRPDDELTPLEALEAQALASAQEEPEIEIVRKPRRTRGPRRRFGDGPFMPDYFDNAVRALDPPVRMDLTGAEEDIQQGVQNVQDTLASFKIDARVTDVKRGPVITRYEVQPAPGVRVATIANLDRDLARSLSAIAVRIEAPVPGKNVVGIEVPNKKVNLVRLRDVLELPEFLSAPSKLSFVLGKDIAGQPKWADLTKMPHLLIAGATNSGKSVCLNTIITSIITRAAPDEVKFSLIDPKRVELTLYRDIPHLYHPVVVEPKEAVRALRGMITEMDRRYKKFAERGVRNIASFNSKLEEGESPLPYIVIVIDELADLMMTAAAEFEKLICRLAQLARATGIHLIVATQRPSVNVITGVIKANIPARIAFAVASQVDSRTILDSVGAERLIGSGDMLFDANNGGKATRIQGSYLSEEECNRIVQVVKAAYAEEDFEYGLDLSLFDDGEESSGGNEKVPSDEKRDELYDQIKEFVLRHQEMSASMIQRKYEIGYPRAGRIVDQLERDGVVGPADGPKPRKVVGNGNS